MANKIFRDMLNPQKKLVRNGFDRSYLNNFTAKIGELLPVMCVETVPGSHYEIKVADFMRTIPMRQAAFIRANQHFDFYFVPYKQLWRYWDDFYTQRMVPTSASTSVISSPTITPNMNLGSIYSQIYGSMDESEVTVANVGDIGENISAGCKKILNLLGYGSAKAYDVSDNTTASMLSNKSANMFRAAAYQKICYDFYRQPFYDLPYSNIAKNFNLDDSSFDTGSFGTSYSVPEFQTIYKRLARMFQLHYRQWKKDLFTGVLPNTQFGAISVVNTGESSAVQQAVQLAVNGLTVAGSATTTIDGLNVAKKLDPSSGTFVDYRTAIYGRDGVLATDGPSSSSYAGVYVGNSLGDDDSPQITFQQQIPSTVVSGTAKGNITIPAGSGTFNVLQLVKAQAVQKWRETTMRAGFRNVDQYDAHFGVKPIFTEKDRCVFIDSVTSPLEVNSVLNTNAGASLPNTGAIPLGEIGGNGMSAISSDKTIQFDAKDFGVIMCIYSMLPEATYEGIGIDFMNHKVLRDDFFTPEYENLGMVPVTMDAFRLQMSPSVNGYAARYFEYKVNTDRQSDEFNYYEDTHKVGSFAGWSPARHIDISVQESGITSPRIFARDLYVNPRYYKDVFSRLPYTTNPNDPSMPQKTIGDSEFDSFIHQCYFDIKCVQPMSVLGLPNY